MPNKLPAGHPPWEPFAAARIGGVAGALVGAIVAVISGSFLPVIAGAVLGAGAGWWVSRIRR